MATRVQKTTIATQKPANPDWVHIDATGLVLGRLATKVAKYLMGKHSPMYTPHVDTGAFVVVTNCEKIRVTGKKLDQETHDTYSGYPSGLRQTSRREIYEKNPEKLLEIAVRRMMPRSSLSRRMMLKLKAYRTGEHPHVAQNPVNVKL